MIRRADGSVETLDSRGLGIGLSATEFEAHLDLAEGRLEPGDALLCYTDGLSEAADGERELFGEGRISEVLAALSFALLMVAGLLWRSCLCCWRAGSDWFACWEPNVPSSRGHWRRYRSHSYWCSS